MPDTSTQTRTMIVTGASKGIGAATARQAAAAGYGVCVNYLNSAEAAEAVVREITEAGGRAIAVKADTSDEDQVRAMFDRSEAELGPLGCLVNNAGFSGGSTRVVDLDLGVLRNLMAVNVIGYFICAQEALKRMERDRGGKGGAIVNVASVSARHGSANERVHYAASKGAIVTFTRGLGLEAIRQGVRVNAVSPGLTETDFHEPGRLDRLVNTVPAQRIATPEEIAETILWLASPASDYIVGENITVSGGR